MKRLIQSGRNALSSATFRQTSIVANNYLKSLETVKPPAPPFQLPTTGVDVKGRVKEIEKTLPVGWAHGDRYSDIQWIGPEKYC